MTNLEVSRFDGWVPRTVRGASLRSSWRECSNACLTPRSSISSKTLLCSRNPRRSSACSRRPASLRRGVLLDTFGVTEAENTATAVRLSDPARWPVGRLELVSGARIWIVWRNYPGDAGIDYYLDDDTLPQPLRLAMIEGHFVGPGFSWPEVPRASQAPANVDGVTGQSVCLLSLLPALGDAEMSEQSAQQISEALAVVGAAGLHLPRAAQFYGYAPEVGGGRVLWPHWPSLPGRSARATAGNTTSDCRTSGLAGCCCMGQKQRDAAPRRFVSRRTGYVRRRAKAWRLRLCAWRRGATICTASGSASTATHRHSPEASLWGAALRPLTETTPSNCCA